MPPPTYQLNRRAVSYTHLDVYKRQVAGCTDTKIHHILHQNIAGIFGAGQACLAQGKACLHEEHKKRCNQCPCNVCGIVHVGKPLSLTCAQKFRENRKAPDRSNFCPAPLPLFRLASCYHVRRVRSRGKVHILFIFVKSAVQNAGICCLKLCSLPFRTFPQIYSFFCKKIYQKNSLCAIISSNSLFLRLHHLKEDHPCPT